jgi:hypothetical protein
MLRHYHYSPDLVHRGFLLFVLLVESTVDQKENHQSAFFRRRCENLYASGPGSPYTWEKCLELDKEIACRKG